MTRVCELFGSGYLNNRYYDPATGAFISVDPLVGETGTPYLYAGGSPVTYSDPTGLDRCDNPSNSGKCNTFTAPPRDPSPVTRCDERACSKSLTFHFTPMPGGGDIYVGAFIPAPEAGVGGFRSKGDDRGFWQDPGDCSRSRACLSADLDAGVGTLVVNYSCEAGGDCHDAWDLDGGANSIDIHRTVSRERVGGDVVTTKSLVITVQATNAVTWRGHKAPPTVGFGVGVTSVDRRSAPSIDFTTMLGFEAYPAYEMRAGGYEFTATEAGEIAGVPFGLGVSDSVSVTYSSLKLAGLPK